MDELMRQYKMNKDDFAMWMVQSYSGRVQEQNYGAENMFAFKYRLCLKNKKKQINYFGFSELLNHQGFKQKKT